jgi:uncharacterized protein YbjT (DUF2867 family)
MNIVILGANGKTGTKLAAQAIDDGHRVTAFVRTKGKLGRSGSAEFTEVVGDARVTADLAKAFVGQDAVLSVLGSMKGSDELQRRASAAIAAAARETGVSRVVALASFMLAPNYKADFMGKLVGGLMKGMLADAQAGEEALRRSNLDWTIVYATRLDKARAGSPIRIIPLTETVSAKNGIARADVARFMLGELVKAHSRSEVVITSK